MHGNLLPEAVVNLPLQHFKSNIVNYIYFLTLYILHLKLTTPVLFVFLSYL